MGKSLDIKILSIELAHLIREKIKYSQISSIHRKKFPHPRLQSAVILQRAWRAYVAKRTLRNNAYKAYLSMIPTDDSQRTLAALMFGRHQAELQLSSKERLYNPYIRNFASYHRVDGGASVFINSLIERFGLEPRLVQDYYCIPITKLNMFSINVIIKPDIFKYLQLFEKKDCSISLLIIPKGYEHVIDALRCAGFTASPWEIALNLGITHSIATSQNSIVLDNYTHLPKNHTELLESSIFEQLKSIATSSDYATQKLAICLCHILDDFPPSSSGAFNRIAMMLDITLRFYANDYTRFSFCVYTVVHEMSFGLLNSPSFMTFNDFYSESCGTFKDAFGFKDDEIQNSTMISLPSLSGTNAYFMGWKLASHLQFLNGKRPKIKLFKPTYFEFNLFSSAINSAEKADIWVISCGPIVSHDGLSPGIEINDFVKKNIIKKKRTKHTVLLIDATTTLYKNLHLDDEVKELVTQGKLSLVVFESHQKFGLIHTDQAQYGRVFALFPKEGLSEKYLKDLQENASKDFSQHLDMRIGAFISCKCSAVLEQIKEAHFRNGSLLRDILKPSTMIQSKVLSHPSALKNHDELYFLSMNFRNASLVYGFFDQRDSFGHYKSSVCTLSSLMRISPDASDAIDCSIQAAQIYIAQYYSPRQLLKVVRENIYNKDELSFEEQVITVAILNNFKENALESISLSEKLHIFLALRYSLERCPNLIGRQYFLNLSELVYQLRDELKDVYQPKNERIFFKNISYLYALPIELTQELLEVLKKYKDDFSKEYIDLIRKGIRISSNEAIALISYPHLRTQFASNPQLLNALSFKAAVAVAPMITVEDVSDYYAMCHEDDFCHAIICLDENVKEINAHLKQGSIKHKHSLEHSKIYLQMCLSALEQFYKKTSRTEEDKKALMGQFQKAQNDFCQNVLGKDRSHLSHAVRLLLMFVTNFIASLSFGVVHYIHYKKTGNILFFSTTESAFKLQQTHRALHRSKL